MPMLVIAKHRTLDRMEERNLLVLNNVILQLENFKAFMSAMYKLAFMSDPYA